jgi:hypothetical protein
MWKDGQIVYRLSAKRSKMGRRGAFAESDLAKKGGLIAPHGLNFGGGTVRSDLIHRVPK